LTKKEILGHVKVKYCTDPTMLLYCVISSGPRGEPAVNYNFSLVDRGVGDVVHFFIPTFVSKSEASFS
jgi:hypothetical protein